MKKAGSNKRIVVYSHDTFGLGNIRRMLAISRALVEADATTSLLVVSGSPMLHAFRLQPRMDYVKLPCLSRDVQGQYGAKSLAVDCEQIVRMRANIIKSTLRHFEPDLLLIDKKPLGVGQELNLAFEDLRVRGKQVSTVLLLRDILDAPDVTRKVWSKHDYQRAIAEYYDRILVVGSKEIFDVPSEYDFSPAVASKVEFCGYIGREPGNRTRSEVRQGFGINEEPLVVVTAGGGEDGYHLLSTYLTGLEQRTERPHFRTLLLCGPEMPAAQRTLIQDRVAQRSDVYLQEFTDDIMSYFAAADVVVSMGGYNTVCEILSLKKRAIIVPRVRPVLEQLIRAQRMQKRGLLSYIHPDQMSPTNLLEQVFAALYGNDGLPKAPYKIDMNGLSRINNSVYDLLFERECYSQVVRGWRGGTIDGGSVSGTDGYGHLRDGSSAAHQLVV